MTWTNCHAPCCTRCPTPPSWATVSAGRLAPLGKDTSPPVRGLCPDAVHFRRHGCCLFRGKETAWVAHHFSLPSSHNSISLLMMKVKWGPPPVPASWKQNRRRAQRAAAASSLLGNAWCVWGAAPATRHSRDGTCEAWSPTEGQRESWSVGTCLAPPWFQDPCHLVIAGWCHNRSLTLCILHGESVPSP